LKGIFSIKLKGLSEVAGLFGQEVAGVVEMFGQGLAERNKLGNLE
jgi:hypothetical protein